MFYTNKVQSKKTLNTQLVTLVKSQYNGVKLSPGLYNQTNHLNNSIFIYQTKVVNEVHVGKPILLRFSRLSGLNSTTSDKYLNLIYSDLVNKFSFNTLYFVLKKLFWVIPVPKHKQLLYFIRALVKDVSSSNTSISGLSITLRGKLAATGNKRKSVFMVNVGKGSSSRINNASIDDFRLIRTATGVLGVTSIITYTR